MKRPSTQEFAVGVREGEAQVTFIPTQTCYSYRLLTDSQGRQHPVRIPTSIRHGTAGKYPEAVVEDMAFRLASAVVAVSNRASSAEL